MRKPLKKINPVTAARADALPLVTLDEFFRLQKRGSQTAMADAMGVRKSHLSQVAAADRKENPGPRVYVSYALGKAMQDYVARHGYRLDLTPLLRTKEAAD